jgi:predicted deacylase
MFRSTRVRAALAAACLVSAVAAAPAAAEAQTTPNGPWSQPNQNESLSAIRDYDELVKTLQQYAQRSGGAMKLSYSPFRAKGSNRQIPIATVGSGPRAMVIIANQHGNEYTVSNSALEIVRALSSNAAGAKAIRDALTVTVIPRVNVDGFDRTPIGSPWRHNVDPWCTVAPCPAFYALGRGYDINRYHSYLTSDPRDDPNTGPLGVGQGDNPVPEALAVRNAYDAAGGSRRVEVVLDLHHQGTKTDADGQMVTGSTLWPNATSTADALGIRPQFDTVVHRSKQVVSTLLEGIDRYGYANFSRYCGTTPPGISRNAYGLLGSASVLIEMRGDIGQKSNGYIAKTAYQASASVVDALADGSLSQADVGRAEALQLTPGETGCPPAGEGDE